MLPFRLSTLQLLWVTDHSCRDFLSYTKVITYRHQIGWLTHTIAQYIYALHQDNIVHWGMQSYTYTAMHRSHAYITLLPFWSWYSFCLPWFVWTHNPSSGMRRSSCVHSDTFRSNIVGDIPVVACGVLQYCNKTLSEPAPVALFPSVQPAVFSSLSGPLDKVRSLYGKFHC